MINKRIKAKSATTTVYDKEGTYQLLLAINNLPEKKRGQMLLNQLILYSIVLHPTAYIQHVNTAVTKTHTMLPGIGVPQM